MARPFVIALTGSIGMGKSTTAAMFADAGIPVWDADAAVHLLYRPGGDGARAIAALVPDAVGPEGVDRAALKSAIAADPDLLARIEAAIHPLVARDRLDFIDISGARGEEIVLVDVPLLFETGSQGLADAVVVVTAPAEVQHARVLARPGMTEAHLDRILSRQLPDAEKRARADCVIETSTMDAARSAVQGCLAKIRKGLGHA